MRTILSVLVACREAPEDPLLATTKLLKELEQHMLDGQYEEVGERAHDCEKFFVGCTSWSAVCSITSRMRFAGRRSFEQIGIAISQGCSLRA